MLLLQILFSRSSGNVVHINLRPLISGEDAQLSLPDEFVPFRLTPNLQSFFLPFGIDGPFTASMTSMARCIDANRSLLQHYVRVFMRDELLAWQLADEPGTGFARRAEVDVALRPAVARNAGKVVDRAKALSVLHVPPLAQHELDADKKESAAKPGGGGGGGAAAAAATAADVDSGDGGGGVDASALVADLAPRTTVSSDSPSAAYSHPVSRLIAIATDERNLVRMKPAWHPWY